ncbi:MAG: DEAD/DEAH box helicase family protein, partial [Clostridia bacterium]|nr:DEAD/DEAH box helicase family protein [Clostridia bacterium]
MGLELYKHNKKAYEKVEAMFEHENHVAIVHATGTGKSFISMKWLFDNKDKKCLFLAPTYEILDQFEEHVKSQGLSLKKDFPNLQFAIYSNLMRKSDKDLKKLQVDNIVLDEFHRCGAPEWGKSINKVIGYNADAKVLGISATPIRYLDNNKNMAEELFHGNIASEITLVDAMTDGILPMPTYISAAYSFDKDIERIQDKINRIEDVEEKKLYEEQLKDAKRMLEKSEGLSTVFEKYIPNKEGKYVVFCRDQKHMQQMMQEAKDWLKNVNSDVDMYTVYSGQGRKANKRNLADFNKSKNHHIKLLFSIEMLNEGVHVPDIDGVIMLRPTESKIIYLQQLGRALSVGHNQHPVVFDIVNNIHGTDSIREVYQEVKSRVLKNGGRDAEGREINLDEFKIIDYLQQPNELIDSLNSLLDDASSPEAKCEKIVQAVINFINDNKRMPSGRSNDKDEANLYERFKHNKTKFAEEQKQRLIDAGVSVFLSQEEEIEQIVSDVIDWLKVHDGKMPSGKSKDKDEAKLYKRFNYHKTKLTEEQKQRLIDAGVLANVFQSQEEGIEQIVSDVIDWVK